MTLRNERDHTPLDTLVHDVQNCLHVVALGMELLQGARGDDVRFAEVSAFMAQSNEKAIQLLLDYGRAAHSTPV